MIELGLQRISRLLARTPLPWRAIHVAGTNGKGSVCAYVSTMLDTYNKSNYREEHGAAILKHGRYTSPHFIDRWDCITIDQRTFPFQLFEHVEKRVVERNVEEGIQASEFELLTATAFEIFTQERVDIGVVEVGMGGRLDATNVIGQPLAPSASGDIDSSTFRPAPLVCAITKIGLDHQMFLGNTLPEIAREKAGILKRGVPVTYDTSNPQDIISEILDKAGQSRSPVLTTSDDTMPTRLLKPTLYHAFLGEGAAPKSECREWEEVSAHTRNNVTVAFCASWSALQQLDRVPKDLTCLSPAEQRGVASLVDSLLTQAVNATEFPGRLQMLNIERIAARNSDILLDGAHNAQSAAVLAHTVESRLRRPNSQNVTWVIATSDTKDPGGILEHLIKDGDSMFAVEFGPVAGMPWVKATSAGKLLDAVHQLNPPVGGGNVHDCGSDVLEALRAASHSAGEGPLVVAGSLYLVGDVLRLLRDSK